MERTGEDHGRPRVHRFKAVSMLQPCSVGCSCRGVRVGRNKSLQATRLPLQAINGYALTLVRPIPCIINQPCPNGIVANVEPFFAIAFLTPQDMIEKARLP